MVRLVDVEAGIGTWELEVGDDQKSYVADPVVILAKAYIFRKFRTRAFWIYHEDGAVGMGLYFDRPEKECYDLSQFLIDKHFQGRGYGKEALSLVLSELRQDGKYTKVMLSYVEGNKTARKLFEQFGFAEVSREYDEISMEMSLS